MKYITIFIALFCGISFSNLDQLKAKTVNIKPVENSWKCPKCGCDNGGPGPCVYCTLHPNG